MIIIFIVLGLGFLGGGVAAIVDGAPYMVLERGFTQVIIGTVVAVAGVVMLALSRVLLEIRRLKATLSGAAVAISMASMAGGPVAETAAPRSETSPDGSDARPPAGLPVAASLAGVGAALAASQASAAPTPEARDEGAPEAPSLDIKAEAPDLFDAYLERSFAPAAEPEVATQQDARAAAVDAPEAAEPDRPVDPPQLSDSALIADVDRAFDWPPLRIVEAEIATPLEASPQPEPVDEPTADATTELPPALPGPADIDDPLSFDRPPPSPSEDDEFGRLRESLAGLGLGPAVIEARTEPSLATPEPLDRAVEPSAAEQADDLAAAASWMQTPETRKAPWFDESSVRPDMAPMPLSPEPERPSSPASPSWPVLDAADRSVPSWLSQPRDLRGGAPDLGAVRPVPEVEAPRPDEPISEPAAPETFAFEAPAPESVAPEPPAIEAPAIDDAPAASDEGIVGAYQVGEAHFTIFADGSIQARTPDGDYSFGSMDELKIYLASEKSRLGT